MTDIDSLAREIAAHAVRSGRRVGAAESLTSGAISVALGKAPDAASWFAGAIVAYQPSVKHELLAVDPGPVVSAHTAKQMADGVRKRLESDCGVAVTGVGGPGPAEGHPAGTVFIAVASEGGFEVQKRQFDGGPDEVVRATVREALEILLRYLSRTPPH